MLGRTKEKIKKYTQPYIKGKKNCESHCKIMPLKYQKNFFGSEVWRMDIFYSYVNTFSFVLFFDNFVSYFWQENSSLLISLEQLDLV